MSGSGWLERLGERWPEVLGEQPPNRETLQAYLTAAGSPLRVIPPPVAPRSYEQSLHEHEIPTRERSWHDTFNVLAFVRFPRSKAALHERVLALQQTRARASRGPEEDALTLLDEAVILFGGTRDDLAALGRARAASTDALHREILRRDVRIACFGHALLEHLKLGRPPIGAGVFEVELTSQHDDLDLRLSEAIGSSALGRPCFSPTVPWPDPRVETWARRADP